MTSLIAVISIAVAVSGLGAAVRASARAGKVQALASASISSPAGRGRLAAVGPHPVRAGKAGVPQAPPPATAPAPAPPAAPTQKGPTPVAETSLQLVDTSRQADLGGPRVLPTSVWYPAAAGSPDNVAAPPAPGGPLPLVVFAHGYNTTPDPYAGLLRSWARAGYVVAAPTFPPTASRSPAGPDPGDMANQAADVRFVIDQLLAVDGKPGLLGGLIDPHKIGVSGHSDGGVTAAVVAFNTCCRDQRISAAVVMAGAGIDMPGGSYFPPGSPPMLAAQGQDDHSNNPFNSLALYMQDGGGPKYLLSLPGASHDGPFKGDGPDAAAATQATLDFLDHYLKGRPGAEQLLHDASVPGVATIQAPPGQG